jgi:hypothetical protein
VPSEKFDSCDLTHYEAFEWQPLSFEEGGIGSDAQKAMKATEEGRDEVLVVIFPRIYICQGYRQEERS